MIHWPALGIRGRHVDRLVSLIDIVPTVVDLLRLEEEIPLPGESLAADVTSPSVPKNDERIVFADSIMWGLERQAAISVSHKCVHCSATEETQLFAWGEDDPGEKENVVAAPEHAEILERFSMALGRWNTSLSWLDAAPGLAKEADEEMAERLRRLGYM